MAVRFNWECPFCNHAVTITDTNFGQVAYYFNQDNKDGDLAIQIRIIVCPNAACKEYCIDAHLYKARISANLGNRIEGTPQKSWRLRPQSNAKPFPSYIPKQILDDYAESCLIKDLSPKASATLSRRCLQGIIRGFWGIKKGRLIDEMNELRR